MALHNKGALRNWFQWRLISWENCPAPRISYETTQHYSSYCKLILLILNSDTISWIISVLFMVSTCIPINLKFVFIKYKWMFKPNDCRKIVNCLFVLSIFANNTEIFFHINFNKMKCHLNHFYIHHFKMHFRFPLILWDMYHVKFCLFNLHWSISLLDINTFFIHQVRVMIFNQIGFKI